MSRSVSITRSVLFFLETVVSVDFSTRSVYLRSLYVLNEPYTDDRPVRSWGLLAGCPGCRAPMEQVAQEIPCYSLLAGNFRFSSRATAAAIPNAGRKQGNNRTGNRSDNRAKTGRRAGAVTGKMRAEKRRNWKSQSVKTGRITGEKTGQITGVITGLGTGVITGEFCARNTRSRWKKVKSSGRLVFDIGSRKSYGRFFAGARASRPHYLSKN